MSLDHIAQKILFLFISQGIIVLFLYTIYQKDQTNHNNEKIQDLQNKYENIYRYHKDVAQLFYREFMEKEEVLETIHSFSATLHSQDLLENTLQPFYKRVASAGFRKLQIHSQSKTSLVNFYDNQSGHYSLSPTRSSVDKISKLRYPIHEFEQGLDFSGLVNIFPLSYKKEFIGSIEFSATIEDFNQKISNNFQIDTAIIVSAAFIGTTTERAEEQSNFQVSALSHYFYEPKNKPTTNILNQKVIELINQKINQEYQLNLLKQEAFVKNIFLLNTVYSVVFLPLFDINQEAIGYLVAYSKDRKVIEDIYRNVFYYILINLILITTVSVYFYQRKHKQMNYIKDILDSQENMIVITDGHEAKELNQRVLEFLNFKSLEEFKQFHECICDFFIQEKGYIYPDKQKRWIHFLFDNSKEHRVKMLDKQTQQERIFLLRMTKLKFKHYYVINFIDISHFEAERNELEKVSVTDKLTGQLNKAKFQTDIAVRLEKKEPFSLIMYDIDHFKDVNDTYGHQRGDEVLKRISNIVRENTRESDCIYRWGGEEFFIITQSSNKQLEMLTEKLRQKIEQCYFFEIGQITCSFGITQSKIDDTLDSIVKRVDKSLYRAKNGGRNRVCKS